MTFDQSSGRRAAACIADVLREETGYVQPVGGPYRRWDPKLSRRGNPLETGKPDGLWYDDDPDDTGGRTAAGILQREYDAYRAAKGVAHRDVWLIDDLELDDIYVRQYWDHVHGSELPAGVDLIVLHAGVLCGVGRGVRFLQTALGVKADGHFGVATTAALASADPGDLIASIADLWRAYLRSRSTAWKFGPGWLARANAVEVRARAMAYAVPLAADSIADSDVPVPSRKAKETPPPSSMAASSTGNTAALIGGSGGLGLSTELSQACASAASGPHGLTPAGIAVALAASPTFWIAAFTIAGAAYIWLERRSKMITQGV